MKRQEERILRAIMEGMTMGIDPVGKERTWQRMLTASRADDSKEITARNLDEDEPFKGPEDKYQAYLGELEMPADEYHETVLAVCNQAMGYKPAMEYPEARHDIRRASERDFDSNYPVEVLMVAGQKMIMDNIERIILGKALREALARQVMIKLT